MVTFLSTDLFGSMMLEGGHLGWRLMGVELRISLTLILCAMFFTP